MGEKQVGVAALVAGILWAVGGVIVVVNVFIPQNIGAVGLMFVAGGTVMTNRKFIYGLRDRQRDVFQMGRDYERSQGAEMKNGVRSLR